MWFKELHGIELLRRIHDTAGVRIRGLYTHGREVRKKAEELAVKFELVAGLRLHMREGITSC